VVVERFELRIVDQYLWDAVQRPSSAHQPRAAGPAAAA
jgi:hypothetical protein